MRVTLERDDEAPSKGLLQSLFWAGFKAGQGWSYARYRCSAIGLGGAGAGEAGGAADASAGESGAESSEFALSVLERGLAPGLSFAYLPKGPELDVAPERRGALLESLGEALAPLVSPRCAFIRFDTPWYEAELGRAASGTPGGEAGASGGLDGGADVGESTKASTASGEPSRPAFDRPLVKGSDVQPPDSVVLDPRADDDALLAAMKPKWRYNIRLALKKGVSVEPEGIRALDEFYSLYETTARRDRIGIHPKSYYAALLVGFGGADVGRAAGVSPDVRLWMARREGKPLAGIITSFFGDEATYLYGASGDEGRELMPAYALQWAAIKAAREAGMASYDFYGIPPKEDPAHPMAGLYRFKTGFGGEIRHYSGAWDYPLKPIAYAAYRAAEAARLYWHKTLRKKGRRT